MIPNFAKVADGIYRGGQPSAFDWPVLWGLGINQVIKLNLDSDALDVVPFNVELFKCPITNREQILGEPDLQVVRDAVGFIRPGTYVHCTHGQDRTGLVIALYRIRIGWSWQDARKEMLEHGFHVLLFGLDRAWHDLSREKR